MRRTFNTKIQHGYDKIAETWAREREWYIEQPSIDEAIAHLKPGAKILDVGCGSGKPIAAYLVEKGFDVYGVDISPRLMQYAERILPKEKCFVADICDFTTDLSFDAVFCWFMLFHVHVTDHPLILQKLYALLKPKGIILISFADTNHQPKDDGIIQIDEHTIESEMFGERFCHSGQSSAVNTKLMKQVGFKIISDKIDQPGNQVLLARKL